MRTAWSFLLVALVGCATAPPEPPLIRGPAGRRAVMVVVDASLGAEARTTARLALDGALELAGAERSAAGVLAAFPDGGRVVLPLGDAASASAIEPCEGRGALGKSCRRALDALAASSAPRGSLILLLSLDPAPQEAPEVERVSSEAAQRGYRLFRVPVESGARAALATIAVEGFTYVVADGAPSNVTPEGGTVATIALAPSNGKSVTVTTWVDPPRSAIPVPLGTDLVLYRPAWEVTLGQDAPPPIVFVGDAVPLAVHVSGRSAMGLGFSVSASSEGKTLELVRRAEGNGVRFEGEIEAPRAEGAREIAISMPFSAGEAHFTSSRIFRFLARRRQGAQPPDISVVPARLDLGAVWIDSSVAASLVIHGDPKRAVKVAVESQFARATVIELGADEEKTLDLLVDPARFSSGDRVKLKAEATAVATAPMRPVPKGAPRSTAPSDPTTPPRFVTVPILCEARRVKLPASFDLGKARAGEPFSRSFPISASGVTPRVVGDEDLGLTVAIEGGELVFKAEPRRDAAPGKRTARVELAITGSSSSLLARPVSLEVEAPPELALTVEPATLEVKGRYGWAEGRIKVSANLAAQLEAQPGLLSGSGARIAPRRDIRLKPADASWDARSLGANEPRELVLRVYLGSDLPPGRYEGTLALSASSSGDLKTQKPLPVTVEIER
jgi:hypothetical protein